MLITKKKIEANDYVTLKLITGDEVFGRVKTIDDTQVELDKPRTVIPTHEGMAMINYIQLGEDGSYSFLRSSIITMGHLADRIKKDYVQAVSNIQLV